MFLKTFSVSEERFGTTASVWVHVNRKRIIQKYQHVTLDQTFHISLLQKAAIRSYVITSKFILM